YVSVSSGRSPGCACSQPESDATPGSLSSTSASSNWKPPANALKYAAQTATNRTSAAVRSMRLGGTRNLLAEGGCCDLPDRRSKGWTRRGVVPCSEPAGQAATHGTYGRP